MYLLFYSDCARVKGRDFEWKFNELPSSEAVRALSQYPKRRLIVRSREVSKLRYWQFKLSYHFEIWQARRQHCCRDACQISERSHNSKYKYRGFETLRDRTVRRLIGYWNGAQSSNPSISVSSRPIVFTVKAWMTSSFINDYQTETTKMLLLIEESYPLVINVVDRNCIYLWGNVKTSLIMKQ